MIAQRKFTEASSTGSNDTGIGSDSYNYTLVDLHDIVSDREKRELLLPVLDKIISSQANLHFAEYFGDKEQLQQNIEMRGNTFRGFLVYAKSRLPIAYAVYYPMIDSEGKRAAYCEDAHVVENFRSHGVAKIVFQELAKRILEEGCEYLQWATDRRNIPFQKFAEKIGAKHTDIITLLGDSLLKSADLEENQLKKGWAKGNFVTREIKPNDVNLMKGLNVEPNIIRNTGDMTFKGFITFKKNDLKTPVAITPGWQHLSTFKVMPGIYLEHPTFAKHLSKTEKSQAIFSMVSFMQEYATSHEKPMEYLRWHVNSKDEELKEILQGKLKLPVDCMLGPDIFESEMLVYKLSNGSLQKLKEDAEMNSDQILHIPRGTPIGPAIRPPSAP